MKPPIPDNEPLRLQAVRSYAISGGQPEKDMHELLVLTAQICEMPIAQITIIEEERQLFLAGIGLAITEVPRPGAFCSHAISQPEPLSRPGGAGHAGELFVVPDALADAQFAHNPLVTGDPYVRFYAGAPLVTPDGFSLGTLCVMDRQPRTLTAFQAESLRMLAWQVMAKLEQRRVSNEWQGRYQELRRRSEHFRILIENAMDVLTILDGAGAICYESPSLERVLGFRPEDIVGMNLFDFVHPEDAPRILETFRSSAQIAGPGPVVQFRFRHNNGTWRTLQAVGNTILDNPGGPRIVVSSRDVTERRRAEERYRNLVQGARDGIVTLAVDGLITSLNPAFEAITGAAKDGCVGTLFTDLLHLDDVPPARAMMQRALAGETPPIFELRLRAQTGEFVVGEFTFSPEWRDGAAIGVLAVVRDVTDRKRLEQQFLQSQRVEAVGRLAGGVAHDFNNILTAVTGYSEILLRTLDSSTAATQYVGEIKKAAERAASLTRQLLAFSRKQMLQPIVLDLNSVVADLETMMRRLIGEDIELVTIPARNLGHVQADPSQIDQVLLNLAVNARDAMPKGGRLTIETSQVRFERRDKFRPEELLPGDYICLSVRDTGTGMIAEVKSHLFEPFYTTKPRGKGTGLGLATCYGIIKQSGGHITVDTLVDVGTAFNIYLPCVSGPVTVHAVPEHSNESVAGNGRILLVEDEPAVRELASLVLTELGYEVQTAVNGIDALHHLQADGTCDFDLLVTDVVMPQMGGKELADRFQAVRPETKVLFISGYTEDAIGDHGVLDASTSFLQKPFTTAGLSRKIQEVLQRAPAVSASA